MLREVSHEMVRLAAASNSFQAHIWRDALRAQGIHCQVVGEYLEAGLGDVQGISAEVWVDPSQLKPAKAFLRRHHHF